MSEQREIHAYAYVNRPYPMVSAVLVKDVGGLLQRATTTSAGRAESLLATLKLDVAGLEIGKEIRLEILDVDGGARAPGSLAMPATRVALAWKAATAEAFFPSMRAHLLAYALGPDETQLDLHGRYAVPGGALGSAVDVVLGHRVAEATLRRFLDDVVERLRHDPT